LLASRQQRSGRIAAGQIADKMREVPGSRNWRRLGVQTPAPGTLRHGGAGVCTPTYPAFGPGGSGAANATRSPARAMRYPRAASASPSALLP